MPEKTAGADSVLMEKIFGKVWWIVIMGTDRVLVANAPDHKTLVDRLCEKWLETSGTHIILIRVYAASHGMIESRIHALTYADCLTGLTSHRLRDVGIVILIEDELGLMSKIDRLMNSLRASKMGDIPVVCVSHLPNLPAGRKIAKWFNHIVNGRDMKTTPAVKNPPAAPAVVPAVVPTPSVPLHPFYRNFASASSAARHVLRGQKKTPAQYAAVCAQNPKLPPEPAKIYPDFERRGGWTMFLTGQHNEADQ